MLSLSKHAKPEQISHDRIALQFWLTALDHDMRRATRPCRFLSVCPTAQIVQPP
jgi:hypothetical protein